MAALLIPYIAGAVVGTGWWYAAVAVGMYIDSAFTYPTLFGADPIHGPQIENQPIARWSEGTPMPRSYGMAARAAGQVIYQSPIEEVKTEESGGKGGGGGSYTTYTYFVNVSVAFGKGPVSRVKQVWADGKTIYNVAPDIHHLTSGISASKYVNLTAGWNNDGYIFNYSIGFGTFRSSSVDLSLLQSGKQVTITGGNVPGGSRTVTCQNSGTDLSAGDTWAVMRLGSNYATSSVANPNNGDEYGGWGSFLPFAVGATMSMHQELPTHSGKHFDGIYFRLGTEDQHADSIIEAHHGIGQVPGFRGTVYVTFRRFALQDWGNRVPSFTALIEEDGVSEYRDVVTQILEESSLDPGEYNTTELPTDRCEGYAIPGPTETIKSLQPLLIQRDILVQQVDNSLRFFPRKNANVVQIDTADLACYDRQPERTPVIITESAHASLPDEVNVDYIDADNEYNMGSQRQRLADNVSQAVYKLNLPIVMGAPEARAIASRSLWTAWTNRHKLNFTLPGLKYVDKLREGDIAEITALGEVWTVLVTKLDHGHNFIMRVEGQVENMDNIAGYAIGEDVLRTTDNGHSTQNPTMHSPLLRLTNWDCRPLEDEHAHSPGFYFAIASEDIRFNCTGAAIYESLDGEDYSRVDTVDGGGWVGNATGYTGATAHHGQWDRVNTITIEMLDGAPSTVTELEVLNGKNRALFGAEVIGFQTATHVVDQTYTLSNLIRGLRGTESQINSTYHGQRDAFVLLNTRGVHFHRVPLGAIGTTRWYKAVGAGIHPEAVEAVPIFIAGLTTRPLPPIALARTLDASNNATIRWAMRSRGVGRILGTASQPAFERKDEYKVLLRNPADSSTALSFVSTETQLQAISAPQQVAAGYTAGDPLTVHISQFSEYHYFGDTTTVTI